MKIKLAIVENEPEVAKAIRHKFSLLEDIELLFVSANGNEAIESLKEHKAEFILIDINLPLVSCVETTSEIRKAFPDVKILIHAIFDADDRVFESILLGASGYILKEDNTAKITEIIENIREGGAPMSSSIAAKVLGLLLGGSPERLKAFGLRPRDLQIIQLLDQGDTYQQVADKFYMRREKVQSHISYIYEKLQKHKDLDLINALN